MRLKGSSMDVKEMSIKLKNRTQFRTARAGRRKDKGKGENQRPSLQKLVREKDGYRAKKRPRRSMKRRDFAKIFRRKKFDPACYVYCRWSGVEGHDTQFWPLPDGETRTQSEASPFGRARKRGGPPALENAITRPFRGSAATI